MTTSATNGAFGGSTATRILEAWIRLENALRSALPACSVQPPTQPAELLAALRINHRIGPEEEARVLALREVRNLVAHDPEEPSAEEAHRFEEETMALVATIMKNKEESC
jgi:hypothetical protein